MAIVVWVWCGGEGFFNWLFALIHASFITQFCLIFFLFFMQRILYCHFPLTWSLLFSISRICLNIIGKSPDGLTKEVFIGVEIFWWNLSNKLVAFTAIHYNDVIMGVVASQITGVPVVCTVIGSGTNQRKYQTSASLALVKGIHCWPMNSMHKGPVTQKMLPFDEFIMNFLFS